MSPHHAGAKLPVVNGVRPSQQATRTGGGGVDPLAIQRAAEIPHRGALGVRLPATTAKSIWPLAAFVALAYAISWIWTFPIAAAGDVVDKGVGWPTHLPALFGPALAALAVTALVYGRAGVLDLCGRSIRWRMPRRWWVATLSPITFLGVALGVASVAGNAPSVSDFGRHSGLSPIGIVPVALIASLCALGEEMGWRGFALPLLQRQHGALAAALLVAPIWVVSHLPYFFTVGTYRARVARAQAWDNFDPRSLRERRGRSRARPRVWRVARSAYRT